MSNEVEMYAKKFNMQGSPGELYASGSGRKYTADSDGFIGDVDNRDVGDLIGHGCSKIEADVPAPRDPMKFDTIKPGDRLEK